MIVYIDFLMIDSLIEQQQLDETTWLTAVQGGHKMVVVIVVIMIMIMIM